MKILCHERPLPGATFEKYQPHLQDEVRHVWRAYKNGIVREIYSRERSRTPNMIATPGRS